MPIFIRVLFFLSLVPAIHASGQVRCGSHEANREMLESGKRESESVFEQWLEQRLQLKIQSQSGRQQSGPYRIPVVFHVIHNGEPVGTGPNVSVAQIESQLKVLNQDFQRTNPDAINTPAEFRPFAGSLDIQFELAKSDPDGLATTGIVRVNGNRAAWTSNEKNELSQLSYWPAEDYLNVWVCNITDYLGLAQFPVSDLPGLENSPNNRLTDGLIIWHRALGSDDDGSFNLDPDYNKGRTATHELGHFFGLKHIWADESGCTGTDHVSDTPNQAGSTTGCPSHPQTSCSVVKMFQNYMDYTDDRCMNLFTQGQVARMITVLENSPRRESLLTSPGLTVPNPVPNDIGIRNIISPGEATCSANPAPQIQVRNYGTNTITQVKITVSVNGQPVETKAFALSLPSFGETLLTFSPATLQTFENEVEFTVIETNGVTDADATNNQNVLAITTYVPSIISVPFTETFDDLPPEWRIVNPDGVTTWSILSAGDHQPDNKALGMEFFTYENESEFDVIYTPVFSLATESNATLYFDLAHARYNFSYDRLKIVALRDCESLEEGTVLFDKLGPDLATTARLENYFRPCGSAPWKRQFIDLSDFLGEDYLQIAFVAINAYGNNLYLDNISVATESFADLVVKEITSPSVVTCEAENTVTFTVANYGIEPITSFDATVRLNGVEVFSSSFSGFSLANGEEQTFSTDAILFDNGENAMELSVSLPVGSNYDPPGNNTLLQLVTINDSRDIIPLRVNFQNGNEESWTNVNPKGGTTWNVTEVGNDRALLFPGYSTTDACEEAWFVSPVLDFSKAQNEASMVFDMSYRTRAFMQDNFSVRVSTDCGKEYTTIDFQQPSFDTIDEPWVPNTEDDWIRRVVVDLSDYAGKNDIRVALVLQNMNANNLYIDNIEFYLEDKPNQIEVDELFNVFGYDPNAPEFSKLKVAFYLEERGTVGLEILDTQGRLVKDAIYEDVLNQVYEIPFPEGTAEGMYIVRLLIQGRYYQSRVFKRNSN